MKRIPLTQGKFALVDDEDYLTISRYKWCFGNNGYAIRSSYKTNSNHSLMHRMIIDTPKGMLTDHINGDKLDNRRSNLRIATKSENMMNAGMRTNNKSGFKGVTWSKNAKKWASQIMINGRHIHFGYFDDPKDAALAHDNGARKYHLDFAKTNAEIAGLK